MKVFTVEWHGDYDGGEVAAVFDSREKAQAFLNKIQYEGAKADKAFDRFSDRMHKIKRALGYPDGTLLPYPSKWDDLWSKYCDKYNECPYRFTYEDYSIRYYDVQ